MEFTSLPDLCSLRILSHLPPRDLLGTVGLVCRDWSRLAREACRRTHSLSLIVDSEARAIHLISRYSQTHRLGTTPDARVARILDRAFRKQRLNRLYCERLVETYPNVDSLEILIGFQLSEPAALQYLLDRWASRLTRLGVWFPRPLPRPRPNSWIESFYVEFLADLDRLTRLRILTISISDTIYTLPYFELPIMEQLDRLDLTLPCADGLFIRALLAQGLDKGSKLITLTDPFSVVQAVNQLLQLDQADQIPALAGKFPHLRVEMLTKHPVECLGAHFRHLQSLELLYHRECRLQIQEISGPLSQLSQLNTLKLVYPVLNIPELYQTPEKAPDPWYPLPSVRVLILESITGFTRHNWLGKELNPAVLLPNLEHVYVNGDYLLVMCGECHHDRPRQDPEDGGRWIYGRRELTAPECLERILVPFDGCRELRKRILTSNRLPNNVELVGGWAWREGKAHHPW